MKIDPKARAIALETVGMTMRFGEFTALDSVSLQLTAGSFHALLGENGAGKSTLVKCMMGYYQATEGGVLVNGREVRMSDPKVAQAHGLGMVYQHFTLVPSLTGAENLVIARTDAPRIIDWNKERAVLAAFMDKMPFRAPLDIPVSQLAAGEKQKLEILKQLYLGHRFLILDEPTSVLTPGEADEILGHVRTLTEVGELTVLLITHKFREVTRFADAVTVLRRGRVAGGGKVADLTTEQMAEMMIGAMPRPTAISRKPHSAKAVLRVAGAKAHDRAGLREIEVGELVVRGGEIVGIAGVSGNGQSELMEILTGQRPLLSGGIEVNGAPYGATRREARGHKVRFLPEEPLLNASAPRMSVAENLAFRIFDAPAGPENGRHRPVFWKNAARIRANAAQLIEGFGIKTASPAAPIRSLSGGNVQRAVLARELSGEVDLLVVSNPCFGLDFSAVSAIRRRILEARNAGTAVLLLSEDLDEILELSDRVLVMSEGRIVFETPTAGASPTEIGSHMAGHA